MVDLGRSVLSAGWPIHLSARRWARLWREIRALDPLPTTYETAAEAQQVLLAILYRALTGVAWEALPASAPPAGLVRATYQRWYAEGLLARLSRDLHVQLAGEPWPAP